MVDIKLKQWADEQLPRKSINIGWTVLKDMFKTMFEENQKSSDDILDTLKIAVIDEAIQRHSWEDKVVINNIFVLIHVKLICYNIILSGADYVESNTIKYPGR